MAEHRQVRISFAEWCQLQRVEGKSSQHLRRDLKKTQIRAVVEFEERALCLLGPWQALRAVRSFFG